MEEHGDEHGQHPPRWVPYTPPPPDGWDRVRLFLRRLSFPLAVLLVVVGIAGLFYWADQLESSRGTGSTARQVPARMEAEGTGEEGTAPLEVRSSPEGATVRMNGDSVGVTPYADSARRPGVYMLSVQTPGHYQADTVVVLEGGTPSTVRVSLRPRPEYAGSEGEPNSDAGFGAGAEAEVQSPPQPSPTPDREETREEAPSEEELLEEDPSLPSTPSPSTEEASDSAPSVGALHVTSSPTGATVTVNGEERGQTPLPVSQIPPGTQEVSLSLDGYKSWSSEVDVRADTTQRIHGDLQQRTGRLRVLARPWGTIYVNDTLHAREQDVWYETSLPVGRHQIRVVHPTLGEKTQEVGVSTDEQTSVVIDLRSQEEEDPSP